MAKRMGNNKEAQKIIDTARARGWEVRHNRGNHMTFVPPDKGADMVVWAGNSKQSDYRALKNLRAMLRRSGLRL